MKSLSKRLASVWFCAGLSLMASLNVAQPAFCGDDVPWSFEARLSAVEKKVADLETRLAKLEPKAASSTTTQVRMMQVCDAFGNCRYVPVNDAQPSAQTQYTTTTYTMTTGDGETFTGPLNRVKLFPRLRAGVRGLLRGE